MPLPGCCRQSGSGTQGPVLKLTTIREMPVNVAAAAITPIPLFCLASYKLFAIDTDTGQPLGLIIGREPNFTCEDTKRGKPGHSWAVAHKESAWKRVSSHGH